MKDNFAKATAFTLSDQIEGGYANNPKDTGGETYRGISRNNWPKWEGWPYIDKRDFKGADAFVLPFYKKNFWDQYGCNDLPEPLDIIHFDDIVNATAGGQKVLAAASDYNVVLRGKVFNIPREMDLLIRMMRYYVKCKGFGTFGKTWIVRTLVKIETFVEAAKAANMPSPLPTPRKVPPIVVPTPAQIEAKVVEQSVEEHDEPITAPNIFGTRTD